MKLSECRTMDDLRKFVPTNQECLYYTENGDSYAPQSIDFIVSKDRESFLALPRSFCYGYGEPLKYEVFNDEQEALVFMRKKKEEKRKTRIEELEKELESLRGECGK